MCYTIHNYNNVAEQHIFSHTTATIPFISKTKILHVLVIFVYLTFIIT